MSNREVIDLTSDTDDTVTNTSSTNTSSSINSSSPSDSSIENPFVANVTVRYNYRQIDVLSESQDTSASSEQEIISNSTETQDSTGSTDNLQISTSGDTAARDVSDSIISSGSNSQTSATEEQAGTSTVQTTNNSQARPVKRRRARTDNSRQNKRRRIGENSVVTDEDTCSICLEKIGSGRLHKAKVLRCGHKYGMKCINKWFKKLSQKHKQLTCPICRADPNPNDV